MNPKAKRILNIFAQMVNPWVLPKKKRRVKTAKVFQFPDRQEEEKSVEKKAA